MKTGKMGHWPQTKHSHGKVVFHAMLQEWHNLYVWMKRFVVQIVSSVICVSSPFGVCFVLRAHVGKSVVCVCTFLGLLCVAAEEAVRTTWLIRCLVSLREGWQFTTNDIAFSLLTACQLRHLAKPEYSFVNFLPLKSPTATPRNFKGQGHDSRLT